MITRPMVESTVACQLPDQYVSKPLSMKLHFSRITITEANGAFSTQLKPNIGGVWRDADSIETDADVRQWVI